MTALKRVLAAGACVVALASVSLADEAPSAATVLASVNGTEITLGHVIALRTRLPQQYQALPDDVLFQGIVDQLIQQTVLMQEMQKKMNRKTTIALENENRAFLASTMIDRVAGSPIGEDALKAAYAARYDGAVPQQEYHAAHILVKTKEEAEAIIKQLVEGADFAKMAQEKSTGPSAPAGGDLDWFGKGGVVGPFWEAVVKLAVGEVSAEPVQTQHGWHVVKVLEMRDAPIPTLDEVRENLTAELQQKALEDEIARLTAAATVTRSEAKIDPATIRDVTLLQD